MLCIVYLLYYVNKHQEKNKKMPIAQKLDLIGKN